MKVYKVIGSYCEVFILLKKWPKTYKVKVKTESRRLLTVLKSKTYLAYILVKNVVIKTPFIKLYELKNLLTLKGVLKPIGIRLLNNVAITEDFIGKRVLLDLPEIDDDIGLLKPINFKTLVFSRPLEPAAPGPSKLSELENRFLKPVLKSSEEFIKFIDSSNLDEIQLDLSINLCYRIKAKIFKKKLYKNNFTPNIYKQALKSPIVKKWLVVIFNEFEQLINLKTLKFLPYKALPKGRKPLTNRLVFKEKKDQYNITIKFKARLIVNVVHKRPAHTSDLRIFPHNASFYLSYATISQ